MLTRRQNLSGFSGRSWVNSDFRASWLTMAHAGSGSARASALQMKGR